MTDFRDGHIVVGVFRGVRGLRNYGLADDNIDGDDSGREGRQIFFAGLCRQVRVGHAVI